MYNPFLKNRKILISYLFIWLIIIAAHSAVQYFLFNTGLSESVTDSIVFNLLYLGIGLSLWYPARFITFENYAPVKVITNHIVSALVTSGIWIFTGYSILSLFFENNEKYMLYLKDSLIYRFAEGLVFYLAITIINYLIIYYTNFREKTLKEAELKALVKEAELRSLKYQINPHFIFNSLNSISSLTTTNPEKAQEMTIKLSSFMRSTLAKNENYMSSLKNEIANAKLYMDIEKVRFEDKFEFTEELSEECQSLQIPAMILQPLFENAIKHGVYESLEKVFIKLACKKEGEYLVIMVENNFDPSSVPQKGEGIGLVNIKTRMSLVYKQDNLLTYSKSRNIFTVKLFIPLPEKGEKNE